MFIIKGIPGDPGNRGLPGQRGNMVIVETENPFCNISSCIIPGNPTSCDCMYELGLPWAKGHPWQDREVGQEWQSRSGWVLWATRTTWAPGQN